MTALHPVHPDVAATIAAHTWEGRPERPRPPAEPDFTDHPNRAALLMLRRRLNDKTKSRAQAFGFEDIEDYAHAARDLGELAAEVLGGIPTDPCPFDHLARHLGAAYRLVRDNATPGQRATYDRLVEAMNDLDDKNRW